MTIRITISVVCDECGIEEAVYSMLVPPGGRIPEQEIPEDWEGVSRYSPLFVFPGGQTLAAPVSLRCPKCKGCPECKERENERSD